MPYLKTLAKRADEPFRPDRVEAKAPEVAPISPAAPVGPAKAASPSTPKLGGDRSRTGSVAVKAPPGLGQPLRLESNLDALDPKLQEPPPNELPGGRPRGRRRGQ